jgi:hypothetical protein
MSVVEPGSGGSSIIERVKNLLLKPGETWDVIDGEPATVPDLYKNWVIPLAAIPAVCGLIGSLVFGWSVLGVTYRPPILSAVAGAAVEYAITLGGIYVLALIIDGLAPNFGATKNPIQAFKVAAYSGTAGWVAGVFHILPALAILAIIGAFYSLFLLYKGLPKLMKAADDKALAYFIVTIIIAIVIFAVAGAVRTQVTQMGGGMPFAQNGGGKVSGTLNVPGAGTVDIGKLQAASKQLEAAAKQAQGGSGEGAIQPTDPELLKGYLPVSVAGYARSDVSSSSGGAGGVSGSTAEGVYTKGDQRITLSVIDMGAAGALASMASAFNVHSSSENGSKYEKVGKVDGRTTMEEYDKSSRHGQYSVMAGDRFMIQAQGEGAPMDDLKAAVASVDPAQLERLKTAG